MSKWLVGALLVGFCFPAAQAMAQTKTKDESKFLRLRYDDKKQPVALETSVVRFKHKTATGVFTVDLIGAVHMADSGYYRQLNRLFKDYDVVLYELVAPKGTRVPKGGGNSDNPLAMVQKIMTMALGLESQTARIDYQAKNFVHADMSPAEMAAAMKKRGDTPLTVFLSVLTDMLRQQNLDALKDKGKKGPADSLDLLSILSDPKGLTKLKQFLAIQLADMESGKGLGKALTTLLVEDRNKACLKVLDDVVKKDKNKKIAIFYGAAHMPDFEKRLTKEYAMQPAKVEWLQAWDLQRQVSLESLMFRLLMDQMKK